MTYNPLKTDIENLASFMKREFPKAVERTPGNEVIVVTAMKIMSEMKEALKARNGMPEDGW